MEDVQRDLSIKEVELKHLTLQLELLTNENAAHVQELQEQISALNVRLVLYIYLTDVLNAGVVLPSWLNVEKKIKISDTVEM